MSKIRRRLLGGLLGLALLGYGAVVGTAHAGDTSAPRPLAGPLPAQRSYRVTLLTGDVVTVTTRGTGCPQVSVQPVGGHGLFSRSCGPDGHAHVVPAAAVPLLRTVIDPALFDVTELIEQGYDDAHTDELPVIVAGGSASGRSQLRRATALTSIGATAGRWSKRQPLQLTRSQLAPSMLAGVRHVWLDRKVRASQAPTTPTTPVAADLSQVGAPDAWASGATGKGVRVAVLDSGIDATHPDLAGKIVATENFSDSPDVIDRVGHGTHVAATIAGTGAASHGLHRGVAPDAQLVVGKVLGDDGFGSDSQVIAGMQWAAPQVSVVNMSLGGDFTDGSDPASQALDALSKQYGTLFVVAADNAGPDPGTISAPASAVSALAVGAVDSHDVLADFSSRGPVTGSHAMKPEIVAPGVDIVSARAAGTSEGTVIDAHYTTLSGTSMATPHVAGAAAILRQRHPDWTGDRLKAALVGAAAPVAAGDGYDHGAGSLRIPPALSDLVSSAGVASLGVFAYPQSGTAASAVAWTNLGDRPVSLRLALTIRSRAGVPVVPGAVTLERSTVLVAAGETARVPVVADEAKLGNHPGEYAGVVTATAGDRTVRTPVAFTVEPPSYDLTVTPTPLPSTNAADDFWYANVINLDSPNTFAVSVGTTADEPATVHVPAGRYSVLGEVFSSSDTGISRDALAGDAEVAVSGPAHVVLDAAHARPVSATVTGVSTKASAVGVAAIQAAAVGGPLFWIEPSAIGADAAQSAVLSTAIDGVDVGYLHLYETFGLVSATSTPSPFQYDLLRTMPDSMPDDPTYVIGPTEQARLARLDEHFHRLDVPATTTGHDRKGLAPDGFFVAETQTDEVPPDRVDYLTPGVPWTEEPVLVGDSPLSSLLLTDGPLDTYAPGSRQNRDNFRQPLRVDWYDDPTGPHGCSPDPIRRTRGNLHVGLATMVDQHQRFNCVAGLGVPADAATLTLSRDGQKIGAVAGFAADFTVPAAPGTYRLVHDQDTTDVLPISTHVTTAWTFRSTGPRGEESVPVPLFALDYRLPLDFTNHPTGSTAAFTVRQSHGVSPQQISGYAVWTSVDDGKTWTAAPVQRQGIDGFTANLPDPPAGQWISLRVSASGDGGSAIDQTIIRAYRAT